MGCLCSKGASSDEPAEVHIKKESNKSSTPLSPPSKREGVVVQTTGVGNGAPGRTVSCISKVPQQVDLNSTPPVPQQVEPKSTPPVPQQVESKATPPVPQQVNSNSVRVSQKVNSDGGGNTSVLVQPIPKAHHKRRSSTVEIGSGRAQLPMARIISMPSGAAGEQAAAGWPSWLTAVAGEAIKGWLPRRADSFEKFAKIGQGTYSTVYKARDLDTGKIVAMKKVRFVNMDPESVRFMAREIYLLRKLDHPNVMKLEGLVTSRISCSLYLVFEYMEHDLAGLAATPGIKFTAPQIKCYMQQLLSGLEHCHNRGVLHRDIKGSNLLIDDNGNLKIADFGLATLFNPDNKQPMTSRVVTLWYRPPELLLGATDYGVAVDLWSTGCILAELLAGKPIMPGRTEVEQLHKIFKLCGSPSEEYWRKSKLPHATIFKPQHPYKRCVSETFKDISPSAFALLDVLLAIEPEGRGSATSALNSEFFTAEPLPCDPSSLPKYPPSKEFDAKLRDEEARKKRAAAKGHVNGSKRRGSADSKAVPAPDANAELQASKQGGGKQNGSSYSSQVNHTNAYESSRKDADFGVQKSSRNHQAAELSKFSGSVAARNSSRYDSERDRSSNAHWPEQRLNSRYNQLEETEPSEKSEWNHHLLDRPTSSQRKGERMRDKEFTTGYVPKKNRIHYSGPLLPPGGNVEEMLKEHERQIQQAVRKARLHKAKTKKNIG